MFEPPERLIINCSIIQRYHHSLNANIVSSILIGLQNRMFQDRIAARRSVNLYYYYYYYHYHYHRYCCTRATLRSKEARIFTAGLIKLI